MGHNVPWGHRHDSHARGIPGRRLAAEDTPGWTVWGAFSDPEITSTRDHEGNNRTRQTQGDGS